MSTYVRNGHYERCALHLLSLLEEHLLLADRGKASLLLPGHAQQLGLEAFWQAGVPSPPVCPDLPVKQLTEFYMRRAALQF